MRDKFDYLSKMSLGTKRGTEYFLLRREIFRKMSLMVHGNRNRNRGGFALAPCNPVTLSPNMDEARERGAKKKK